MLDLDNYQNNFSFDKRTPKICLLYLQYKSVLNIVHSSQY